MSIYNIENYYDEIHNLTKDLLPIRDIKLNRLVSTHLLDNPNPKEINSLLGKLAYYYSKGTQLNNVHIIKALNLIKSLNHTIFEIVKDKDDYYLINTISLDKKSIKNRKKYHIEPPKDKPEYKDDLYGLVLNGKDKLPKNLAFINKIKSIPWTLDTNVLIEEKRPKMPTSYSRHNRIMADYWGREFYFDWSYDKRGRSYSMGYDINLQSDEYHKALLNLPKEKLTDVGITGLKYAIAGHAGKDKLTWKQRLEWFDSLEGDISTDDWDEPILGRKALRAWNDSIEDIPTGYWMSLDATASGLQIMAILTDCEQTAELTNLTDPDKMHDLYGQVQTFINSRADNKVTRDDVKYPLMTTFYNSKEYPKKVFDKQQLELFYEAIDGLLPGPAAVLEILNACWNKDALYHQWTLPDGHVAHVPVEVTVTKEIDDPDLGKIVFSHKANEPSSVFRSLAPNVIHSIDGWIAREMIMRANFPIAHIHDCFIFHPNYHLRVKNIYKEILTDLNEMDLLSDIVFELTGKKVSIKPTSNLSDKILKSSYALS